MRARIRAVHRAESFAQSARSGTRLFGSRASSCADFLERQPDLLREDDERDAPDHRARIAPVAGVGALGPNQPLVLVETQGRGRHAAALRHLADRQHAVHAGSVAEFPLDFKCT